ncbi:MAG: hypothetical protein SGILL_003367 [Bacillariaceae sp.]
MEEAPVSETTAVNPLRISIHAQHEYDQHQQQQQQSEHRASSIDLPASIAASIDMSGRVARGQHKVVAALVKQRKLKLLREELHENNEASNAEESHGFFTLRRRYRKQQPLGDGHNSSEEFEAAPLPESGDSQQQLQSATTASSGSLFGVRERFQRWHIYSKQAPTSESSLAAAHPTALKAQTTMDSMNTAATSFTNMSDTSKRTIGSYGGSSLLSMGRLSSRLSIGSSGYEYPSQHHLQPQHPPSSSQRPSCRRIEEESSRTTSSNVNPQADDGSGSPSSSAAPAGSPRFFKAESQRRGSSASFSTPLISVQDLELVLDDEKGEMGLYSGTLDMDSKKPHGKGKMLYFCTSVGGDYDADHAADTSSQELEVHPPAAASEPFLIYEGQWAKGDWCGFGTLADLRHGHTYEGGFFDNYKHGLGVLQYGDGRTYDGIFSFGKLEGKGHLEYPDGSKYWGHWTSDGIEHGRGKKVFADGRVYDGEFDNGVLHGHGRMTFPSGSWYLGEWCDNEPNGLGIQVEQDGTLQFEGTFCHGRQIEGASCPNHNKKSDGDFLCYRSSVAKHGTLVGGIPKHVTSGVKYAR